MVRQKAQLTACNPVASTAASGRSSPSHFRGLGMSVWSELQYLPLGLPRFSLLAAIYFVVVVWILARASRLASMGIGIGSNATLILLAASLGGSYLNIPVAQLPEEQVISGQAISYFGINYVVPTVTDRPGT